MEPVKQIEYKDCKINIYQDEHYKSPNDWQNEDIFLIYEHRQFKVKREGFDPIKIWYWLDAINRKNNNYKDSDKEECEETLENYDFSEYYVFPVILYSHSGLSLFLNDKEYPFNSEWDTSMRGFVLVKKDLFESDAKKMAKKLINTWNDCLSGNVCGYMIETPDGKEHGGCWSFYGDNFKENGLLNAAKSDIDNAKIDYKVIFSKTFKYSKDEVDETKLNELGDIEIKYVKDFEFKKEIKKIIQINIL